MAHVPTSGMLIGAFAAAVGVGIETVRYYERRGLLPTSVAERGRGRRYDASAVSRLTFIKAAQDLGFSLDEVGALLRLNDGRHCGETRQLAESKLRAVRQKREALLKIDHALSMLIEQCGTTRATDHCPLIAALSAT
jgi:MerR family transcriptional regulator, mercuric resistance operon regulatory protein